MLLRFTSKDLANINELDRREYLGEIINSHLLKVPVSIYYNENEIFIICKSKAKDNLTYRSIRLSLEEALNLCKFHDIENVTVEYKQDYFKRLKKDKIENIINNVFSELKIKIE